MFTRQSAAEKARMSTHQAKQAARVASVPADVFDTCIEDGWPATVTQPAEMGKREVPIFPRGNIAKLTAPHHYPQ